MTSDNIFDIIEAIAADPSKSGKQEIVGRHALDEDFKRVLVAALDPMVTYGLAKRPQAFPSPDGTCNEFNAKTWSTLDHLASRMLTGGDAIARVASELGRLTSKSQVLLWRIISKDLRAGFSESTVNKAIPGLITTFECMLAHPFEAKRVTEWPQWAEPKLDGVRVLAFVDTVKPASAIGFFSRSGKEFTTFEHLKMPLWQLVYDKYAGASLVFDGEIVSGTFNKTVGDVRRKDSQATDAQFHVFDAMVLDVFKQDGKGGVGHPYLTRRTSLVALLGEREPSDPIQLIPAYAVNGVIEIHSVYESVRARGLEGLIIKDPKALYHRRRNHGWMKIKAEESVDVKIVGAEIGKPGTKNENTLGALIVDFKGVNVSVGSGFSPDQETRDSFWAAFKRDEAAGEFGLTSSPELIGRLIEVEFHEVTPDGSLRHPRFKRFRDDKPAVEAA